MACRSCQKCEAVAVILPALRGQVRHRCSIVDEPAKHPSVVPADDNNQAPISQARSVVAGTIQGRPDWPPTRARSLSSHHRAAQQNEWSAQEARSDSKVSKWSEDAECRYVETRCLINIWRSTQQSTTYSSHYTN
ncbi:hypothetical protein MRB53_038417 [Persea americana]|nr:hypothetical protein MRB53_038417 [Persea americana]